MANALEIILTNMERKMTDKMPDEVFNPDNHVFGMAYKTHDGQIGYLIDWSWSMGFVLKTLDGKRFTVPRRNKLYRAHKSDLVIRKDDPVLDRVEEALIIALKIRADVHPKDYEPIVIALTELQKLRGRG